MVQASCEMRASPYEAEEMEFLTTLCEKIRQDNSIILLYIQVRKWQESPWYSSLPIKKFTSHAQAPNDIFCLIITFFSFVSN